MAAHGPGEAEAPPANPDVQPVTNFPDIGAVDGDQKPNWDEYDKKYGEDPGRQPDTVKPAPDPAKGEQKQPEQKPPESAPKGESGPTGPKHEENARDRAPDGKFLPSGASGPSGVETKPAGASGPSGPSGAKEFDPDAALKKLDAIQPKPNASEKTLNGFRDIKEITRAAINRNKELAARLAEVEKAPKIDATVEKELAELREFRASFEAQHDPKIAEEFKTKLDGVEDKIIEMLTTDEDLMMPADQAARLKAVGFDSPQGRNMINGILNAIAKTGDQLLLDRVKESFRGRKVVVEDHDKRLAEIESKAGQYWQQRQEAEESERKEWAGQADKKLIALFDSPGYEWGHYKQITEGMDAASKAAAEAHNTNLRDVVVPRIREAIQAVYSRDPDRAMEYVARAQHTDRAIADRDAMKADLDKANQRIKELEQTAAGVTRISDPTREDNAPAGPATKPGVDLNQTAEQAADAYMEEKYGRR